MAKKQIPIPPPDDKHGLLVFCIPEKWLPVVKGAVHSLSYWWQWDYTTGDVKGATAKAKEIYEEAIWLSNCELNVFVEEIQNISRVLRHMDARIADGYVKPAAYYENNISVADGGTDVFIPSIGIYDGWIEDLSLAQIFSEALFAPSTGLTSTLSFDEGYKGLADWMKKIDTDLRHLDAKFSRTGLVLNELADGDPLIEWPFLPPLGSGLTGVFTAPSVWTYDRTALFENEWATSVLYESLRAGVRPSKNIPGFGLIGGTQGVALADLFKEPEPEKVWNLGGFGVRKQGSSWTVYVGSDPDNPTSEAQIWPIDAYRPEGRGVATLLKEATLRDGSGAYLEEISEKLSNTARSVVEAIDDIALQNSTQSLDPVVAVLAEINSTLEGQTLSQSQQQQQLQETFADMIRAIDAIENVAIAVNEGCVNYKSTNVDCGSGQFGKGGTELEPISDDEDAIYYDDEDCMWVDTLVDGLITLLEYSQYALLYIGAETILYYKGAQLVAMLANFRWFARAVAVFNITIAAGPDPTDIATIGIWLLSELFVSMAADAIDSAAIMDNLRDNREMISDYLCDNLDNATAEDILVYLGPPALLAGAAGPLKKLLDMGLKSRRQVKKSLRFDNG